MRRRFSGRFVLRIPPTLHERLDRYARQRGSSLNQTCLEIITEALAPVQPGVAPARSVTSEIVAVARDAFGEHLLGVVFFGSRARGEGTASSDYDLLWVVDDSVPIVRDVYRRVEALIEDPRHSVHVVHLPRSVDACGSVWLEAAIDGLVLYDANGSVHRLLAALRREIARGALVPKTAHGQPYWVRSATKSTRAANEPSKARRVS